MTHEPVLLQEVLSLLALRPGMTVVDCTLGRAGHATALAQAVGAGGLIIGLDVDPRNLEYARTALPTARLFHANFARLNEVLAEAGIGHVDAILADLGVATTQLLDGQYGLSFAQAGPLDMRLDPGLEESAADLVNNLREEELADIFFHLAQERFARRIARKIVEVRGISPIIGTEQLVRLVADAIGRHGPPQRIHPATRTFLALRMAVNREMENLAALLEQGPRSLAAGGRMAVISFQSMEDRLVKQAFAAARTAGTLSLLTRKPIVPGEAETARNPRSRSAKLRAATKN